MLQQCSLVQRVQKQKEHTWSSVPPTATESLNPQLPFPSALNRRLCTKLCLCTHVSMYTLKNVLKSVLCCSQEFKIPGARQTLNQDRLCNLLGDPQSWEAEAADLNSPSSPLTLYFKCSCGVYAPYWI